MKLNRIKKYIAVGLVFLMTAGNIGGIAGVVYAEGEEELESLEEMQHALDRYKDIITYEDYYSNYAPGASVSMEYTIEAADYVRYEDMTPQILEDYQGMPGKSVLTDERGLIEYEVTIQEEGLYNMQLLYYPIEGRSADIQRAIFIDEQLPFSEASVIEFTRIWVNEGAIDRMDTQGNHLKPRQVEEPDWCIGDVSDHQDYYADPFSFYLTEGVHRITFVSEREPMLIRSIRLYQYEKPVPYADKLNEYRAMGYTEATGRLTVIEAETADRKSSPMLYPTNDRSSPAVEPYSAKYIFNNTIGGNNWQLSGQWIEWDIEAEESGLYQIALNVKQNFIRGAKSYRKLSIDGIVPFAEAESLGFAFQKDWRSEVLGNDDGEPFLFYLEKGTHTIRIEVVLGELRDYVRRMEQKVKELNEIYRQVIMVTSTEPDIYRDYRIEQKMPQLPGELARHRDELNQMYGELVIIAGGKGQRDAVLQTMAQQLDVLAKDVEKFTTRLGMFKTNIGALGTWLMQAKEQTLQLDALAVYSPDEQPPRLRNSFFRRIKHEVLSMIYSFIIDYNAIGNTTENDATKSITLWNGQGRDQANTLKYLIDESFTSSTGISVNLMLVDMGTLLAATLAGQGPDVAMQVGGDLPMNYGMRGAVYDLSNFSDLNDVISRFSPEIMTPFTFENRVFALPETMSFNMLFYRKDILDELNIELPRTWDDISEVISILSVNNLAFGMSANQATIYGTYGMFLLQNGGEFYTADYKRSALDSDIAINSFKQVTKLYTDYRLEQDFDFANRFRTGEIPIGVADYSMYNTFQVFAPEIKGLWGFTLVPGTPKEDGTIDHSVLLGGNAIIIMEKSKDKASAWEYLKWWTSADTQTKFGREMEALMGSAARYNTANLEALRNLPWPVEDYDAIYEQMTHAKGNPQVPGGYFTGRYVNNAFYTVVVNATVGAREALMDNIRYINEEIAFKRAEFGLEN